MRTNTKHGSLLRASSAANCGAVWYAVAVGFALTADCGSLAQCLRYAVTTISTGCPPGFSSAQAVSPIGEVVGYFGCGPSDDRAFVWWGGGPLVALSLPNQYWSRAYDINSNQHITGTVEILGTGIRAYLYVNGGAIDLGVLPNHDTSEGFALNASDVVVGYSANTQVGPAIACRWLGGAIDPLSLPNGPDANANDINNSGQIVGWMGSYPAGHFPAEAFLWENGKAIHLSMPAGATNSTANAISNSGVICGYYTIADPQGAGGYKPRALAWIDGQMIDLGVLSGYLNSRAFDVNDNRDIIGYCNNPPSLGQGVKGFIWRSGQMIAIADLLAPEFSQYQVKYAYGINNSGQIAAKVDPPAAVEGAALLTPVPPRAGDTNCDWLVNVNDLLNVINAWGPAPPQVPFQGSPDLNLDGVVNVNDLLIIIQDWG